MATNSKFAPRASSNLIKEGEAKDEATEETTEETAEAKTETETENSGEKGVTFSASVPKVSPIEKNVKVCFAKDYRGCVGGTWYNYHAGETANVPENLKMILNETDGMLKPL